MKRQKKKDPLIKIEAKTEKAVFRPKMLEHRRRLLALTVALITFLVYLPALKNGFVNWDDGVYVYENNKIRSLDFEFFKWAFTSEVISLWHPFTMVSYAFNYAVWGPEPWGYHFINNLFHAFNTFLVFLLAVKVVKLNSADEGRRKEALTAGLVTALLFGIHPIHVESVAWVSERKDVLSAFFYLLCILAYLKYASAINSKRIIYYVISFTLFIFALMSKPMAVSLPIVLLILDFYPLGRLIVAGMKTLLFEKLPFFLLSFLASLVTIWVHQTSGALPSTEDIPLVVRVFVAVRAYIFYLAKMILPIGLAPLYPYPVEFNFLGIEYIGSLVLFAVVTFLCIKSFKRKKLFLAVWLYYIVTLVPTIGLVQVGLQAAADRYTYLPSLGPFMLTGFGIAHICEKHKGKWHQIAIITATLLVSGFLANKTVKQIAVWRDSITLWTHQIKMFPGSSAIPYGNLGVAYLESGDNHKAIENSDLAIEIDPQYAAVYINRGLAYDNLGDYQQAVKDYNKAIDINPQSPIAYFNRGLIFDKLGEYQQAIQDYSKSIALDPESAETYYERGGIYFKHRDHKRAIKDYLKATELNPRYVKAYFNLGTVYNSTGNYQLAIKAFAKAIKLEPNDTRAYTNRGSAYSSLGDYKAAIEDFSMAVKIDPRNMSAYYNLGVAYSQIGDAENSIANYKKAAGLGLKEARDLLRKQGIQ